jgi:two-component system nitrogen regulation sensor histidine kinase NtrY
LERRDANLYQEILNLRPGENKIVSLTKDKNVYKTLMAATAFQTDGRVYKLVAFQDVNEALDETEAKAWQRLLSVMTHEIMNSVAPISSLAETMLHRLKESARLLEVEGHAGALEDLELGIGTIQKRSEGLLKFAETYRNLNKITTLNLKKVYARDLFETLHVLMEPTLGQKNIEMDILLPDTDLALEADTNLIEQVLINLVVNAIDAVKDRGEPLIALSAYVGGNGRAIIKVSDNGMGMSPEVMDNIFIPFFSTKKTGSGIGLSLCKQILLLHKGNIQVQSVEGVGSSFLLHF